MKASSGMAGMVIMLTEPRAPISTAGLAQRTQHDVMCHVRLLEGGRNDERIIPRGQVLNYDICCQILAGPRDVSPVIRAAHQVRVGHPPQDSQGARADDPAIGAAADGWGNSADERSRATTTRRPCEAIRPSPECGFR